MNLIGYLRVSTDEQVRNGQGLDIQRQAIVRWASSHNHTIVAWCSDEGITGTRIDRPGLLEVYELLTEADGVVAQADTRYGRTLEVQESFFGKVWSMRKHVFSVDVGEIREDDPDDPMRTAMRRIRGVMAELEAGLIRKRLSDGRIAARAQGKRMGGPRTYGWQWAGTGRMIPVRSEQDTLYLIKEWREAGITMTGIVNRLNERRIPTTNGAHWSVTQLKRMLPPGVHPDDRKAHTGWLYKINPPVEQQESII